MYSKERLFEVFQSMGSVGVRTEKCLTMWDAEFGGIHVALMDDYFQITCNGVVTEHLYSDLSAFELYGHTTSPNYVLHVARKATGSYGRIFTVDTFAKSSGFYLGEPFFKIF